MYAAVVTQFGGPEVLEYREVERHSIGSTQVLIKVAATSVNYADIKGRYGNKGATQPPYIPGLDVAGTIVEVGSEVEGLHVGQRVIAFPTSGSYAEYAVADAILTFALPDSIDFRVAAACPIVSFTSYKLLADVARLEPGENVLIHAAAGGIGTTAIQLAKLLGASQVIGVVSQDSKAEVALRAGADAVINSSKEDFAQRVLELTDGRGVDVILDSVAGRVTEQSMQCLAWYGRLVQFGNSSGEVGRIQLKDLHSSCRSVLGFSFGTTRELYRLLLREVADKVLGYIADGSLQIMICDEFPLRDAKLAHELVESRQSKGKVLLVP
jgi:NADPH:quinone reductase